MDKVKYKMFCEICGVHWEADSYLSHPPCPNGHSGTFSHSIEHTAYAYAYKRWLFKKHLTEIQQNIDPEYIDIVNKRFWELI